MQVQAFSFPARREVSPQSPHRSPSAFQRRTKMASDVTTAPTSPPLRRLAVCGLSRRWLGRLGGARFESDGERCHWPRRLRRRKQSRSCCSASRSSGPCSTSVPATRLASRHHPSRIVPPRTPRTPVGAAWWVADALASKQSRQGPLRPPPLAAHRRLRPLTAAYGRDARRDAVQDT